MTPRQLVFSLLQKAEKNRQYSNIALDHALESSGLGSADRSLAAALFYGVIERKLTLDHQLSALSNRPLSQLDSSVLTALRMGLYQLIYLDRIPPHAAIYESVALVSKKSAGFVNAILRSYTRAPSLSLPDPDADPIAHLSVAYSASPALCEKLVEIYGIEETQSILSGFCHPAPTTVRVNTVKTDRDALLSQMEGATPTPFSPVGLRVKGSVRELYGFEDGLFFVQDEASQLCVEAIGAKPGERIADICACPGSKSFGIAMNMQNQGELLSFDLHENKLSLIESGAKRLGLSVISCAAHDGRDFLSELEGGLDRVLCDVPCSGFGVLAKKPELRYKDPAESAALPDIQLAILENACRYVKAGGTLVYSTCTILPEENQDNIRRFLERHPDFSLSPFFVGETEIQSGMKTLFPHTHGTDGFFIAKLTRNEEL